MKKEVIGKYRIALAGNPNVGKSTVFNALTGMNQHTGNWPGKTVSNATGTYEYKKEVYQIYDLPGTYSLVSHSEEEEIARDFLCFEEPDVTVVVCDAVCLERNLNLVLQTIEIHPNTIVCVNLLDEAKKKKMNIDLNQLSKLLGVPVVGTSARSGKGLEQLQEQIRLLSHCKINITPLDIHYDDIVEGAIERIEPLLIGKIKNLNSRWVSLKLLDDDIIIQSLQNYLHSSFLTDELCEQVEKTHLWLSEQGIEPSTIKDRVVGELIKQAEQLSHQVVTLENKNYASRDRKIDRLLTNRWLGLPIMLALFATIFWITISGANYPSQMLSDGLFWLSDKIQNFMEWIHIPQVIISILIDGVYRVLAWVIAVMLPPMAIFFPMFTLLEDLGYLPRIAFNLDKYFHKCSACGKQALTMCMGFGCNAAGVTGCRIIDSPRERLIAILTNNFVPCNGRFPLIISILSIFFVGVGTGSSIISSLLLTGVILLGIIMTLAISKILSKTILKGVPSSFTLELPPYRKPQIGKVIVRSIFDRTLFVLGRAIVVAAPAGLIIWLMANISIGGSSILALCSNFLDPFAQLFGLDGVILMAFILGFPANEIVIPIMIMGYMALGKITEITDLSALKEIFVSNGWTWLTALCVIIFSLMHFPCSTTCLTIKKETGSWKWTLMSILIPTVTGLLFCFVITQLVHLFGLL